MSEVLNFRRLGMLIRRQWAENSRFYMLASVAMLGLMAMVFAIWIIGSGAGRFDEEDTWVMYLFGLFIAGCIFASHAFSPLADKSKGIYWLSLPASHLEKLITTIFFTTVVFFIVYSGLFMAVRQFAFSYIESKAADYPGLYSIRYMVWDDKSELRTVAWYFFLVFLSVQLLFLLGSVYFQKFAYIKTVIAGAVFTALFAWMITGLHANVLPQNLSWNFWELRSFNDMDAGGPKIFKVSDFTRNLTVGMLKYMWVPVFLVAAFFRLKEKEI